MNRNNRGFSALAVIALGISAVGSNRAIAQSAPAYLVAMVAVPTLVEAGSDKLGKTRTTSVSSADGVLTIDEDGAQVKDDLFDGTEKFAAKAKESNEVNLDKSMLGLAGKKGGEKGDLAKKLDFVVVRNYEYANEGDYNMADVTAYFKKLDAAGWKHLVRTRSAKESTDICVKQDNEGVTQEMVIISAEPKELSFVHLKGNVTMADMKNFGGLMNGGSASVDPKLQKR